MTFPSMIPIAGLDPRPLHSEPYKKRGSCLDDMPLPPQTQAAPNHAPGLSPVDAPRQKAKKNRGNQPIYSQSLINATHEAKVANCDKCEDVVDEGSDNELNAFVHLVRI